MPAIWTPREDAPGVEECRSGHEIEWRTYAAPYYLKRVVDADQRIIDFVLSSGAVDSHRTAVDVKGMDLRPIRKHAPWLAFHDHWSVAAGRIIDGRKLTDNPDRSKHKTEVRVHFAGLQQHNDLAETLWWMHHDDFMRACSAGFVPTQRKERTLESGEVILDYTRSVLLEGSSVNIGSNPDAYQKREALEVARRHLSGSDLVMFERALLNEGQGARVLGRAIDSSVVAEYLDDYDPAEDRSFDDWQKPAPVGGRIDLDAIHRSSPSAPADTSSPAVPADSSPAPESGGAEARTSPESEAPPDAVPGEGLGDADEEQRDVEAVANVHVHVNEEDTFVRLLRASEERLREFLDERLSPIVDRIAASDERIAARLDAALAELWGDEQDRLQHLITTRAHDPASDPAPASEARNLPAVVAPPTLTMTRAELQAFADRASTEALRRYRGEIDV